MKRSVKCCNYYNDIHVGRIEVPTEQWPAVTTPRPMDQIVEDLLESTRAMEAQWRRLRSTAEQMAGCSLADLTDEEVDQYVILALKDKHGPSTTPGSA